MAALQAVVVAVACGMCLAVTGVAAYYDQSSPSLQQVAGVPAPDPETASFLLPRLAHKYRPPTGDWLDVPDPRLYLLTENDNDELQQEGVRRLKRTGLGGGPSLSIVNPLDVLRQRLLLEIARRRMRQSEEKIQANREWLKSIGKRSISQEDSIGAAVNKLSESQHEVSRTQPVFAPRWTSVS